MAEVKEVLLDWFSEYKRDLPWRKTVDPYFVWVSEIILQQTQVKQGLPYYEKFVSAFPTVQDLANAPEDKVLKLWQGLGYYSRARNMQFAAKQVVNDFNGEFPSTYPELLKLKGVGEYTAAAIASFCFKEVVPVVDGNVYRFISRYFGINKPIDEISTQKEIKAICKELISHNKPDVFNQAIMEFGALQCKPKQVNCEGCPFNNSCWAYANTKVDELPFKAKKIKKRTRYLYYLLLENEKKVLVRKRSNNDIWAGLYELPFLEQTKSFSEENVLKSLQIKQYKVNHISGYKKHLLSHQTLYAKFFHVMLDAENFTTAKQNFDALIVEKYSIHQYAYPKLIENYFTDIGF